MTDATITRTQIIVVGEVSKNTFGDLVFTDKAGGQYKIPVKRAQYFEKVIVPGAAVQLNYVSNPHTPGEEYIYSAVQVKDILPPTVTAAIAESKLPPKPKPDPELPPISGQQTGMTTKELGDMIRAGKLKELFGLEASVELVKWYRSQILATTRITFDGAKLPVFATKKEE